MFILTLCLSDTAEAGQNQYVSSASGSLSASVWDSLNQGVCFLMTFTKPTPNGSGFSFNGQWIECYTFNPGSAVNPYNHSEWPIGAYILAIEQSAGSGYNKLNGLRSVPSYVKLEHVQLSGRGAATSTIKVIGVKESYEYVPGIYTVSYYQFGVTIPSTPNPANRRVVEGGQVEVEPGLSTTGYTFSGWSNNSVSISDNKFTMPPNNIVFTGTWLPSNGIKYKVELYKS